MNWNPFKRTPEEPVRKCLCSICGKEKDAPSWWDGKSELVCIVCSMALESKAKAAAKERQQFELIKQAVREVLSEETVRVPHIRVGDVPVIPGETAVAEYTVEE